MFCENCGDKLIENSKFCGKCGAGVSEFNTVTNKNFAGKDLGGLNVTSENIEKYSESYIAKIIYAKSRRRLYLGYFLLVVSVVILISLGEFGLFWLGGGLLCWGLWIVIRRKMDIEDKKHYVYQIIASAGYQNIDDLSNDFIQAEKAGTEKIGFYTLSNKFLFKENYFSFTVYPLSQMYWVYKKVTQNSINFIPTGKDYAIVMHFRPKKEISIIESEEKVHKHLELLINLCPEAKFGYTK